MNAAAAGRLLLVVTLLCSTAWAEVAVPPVAARVTDQTATLSMAERQTLERRLADFEADKGSQIAILIVSTTQPETIEQYSMRVAEQWKLGRKGIDDGALLLIAKDDRKLRIEVGYGLEGALPDVTCKRIISEIITPYFKTGDFYGGINAGVDKMISVINGEALPPPATQRSPDSTSGFSDWLVPLIFFTYIGAGILTGLLGRVASATILSVLASVVAWGLIGTLVSVLLTAVVTFLMALVAGEQLFRSSRSGVYLHSGGWSVGSSGGGFSGGGGSFGGGGASGSW